jgi:hypothetical protein
MGLRTTKQTRCAAMQGHAVLLSEQTMARPHGAIEMTWRVIDRINAALLVAVVVALVAGVI